MIGLHQLLFAAAVSILAPRVLHRADWVYRSPRLGIAAWYATLTAVISALVAAVGSWLAPWQGAGAPVCMLWRWCVLAAQGGYGPLGQVLLFGVAAVGAGLAARLAVTAVRVGRAASARRHGHIDMLTLAGRVAPEWGATIVDHPHPAAYLVGGSDRRVVLTTGAIAALTDEEIAAVLAHERAHAAGRHDLLLDGVRLLAAAFPRMALFSIARAQLARLVELRADEVATAHHAPISLARALVAMATAAATTSSSPALAGAVPATGGDALERLNRLLTPPRPLRPVHRLAICGAVVTLALVPAMFVVAAQFLPMLGACPPFGS